MAPVWRLLWPLRLAWVEVSVLALWSRQAWGTQFGPGWETGSAWKRAPLTIPQQRSAEAWKRRLAFQTASKGETDSSALPYETARWSRPHHSNWSTQPTQSAHRESSGSTSARLEGFSGLAGKARPLPNISSKFGSPLQFGRPPEGLAAPGGRAAGTQVPLSIVQRLIVSSTTFTSSSADALRTYTRSNRNF